jgi:hypothetical protein
MTSWRKILASFFGVAGLSSAAALGILTTQQSAKVQPAVSMVQIGLIALGALLALISVFVWTGRGWARKVLIGALLMGMLALAVLSVFDFIDTTSSAASGFGNVCFYISLLTFPVLLLGVLLHPDVAREFRRE